MDQKITKLQKEKLIKEITSIDKAQMFVKPKIKKVSLFTKMMIVLGLWKKKG